MTQMNEYLQAHQPEMIKSLQRLIRHRSVEDLGGGGKPFGEGVHACLEEAFSICKELGFETSNMDDMVGWCEIGSGEEMVAVLGHLDVVPEADGWDVPPYEGRIVGDKMFGRGTIDDKGPVVSALYALKAIRDLDLPLKRRVRILFGLNEETGAIDMKYYRSHGGEIPVMGFTPDGEYPLINGEKGIINETYEKKLNQTGDWRIESMKGGVAGNVAPDYAQAVIHCPKDAVLPQADKIHLTEQSNGWLVEADGVSAHGSHPETGENAIGRLAIYLKQLPFEGDMADALTFLADRIGMECYGEHMGCALEDELSGKFTFNMGVISADEQSVSVKLNYRYPVTYEYKDCQPVVQKAFEEAGWVQTAHLHKPKLYIPEDSQLVQSLLKVYREATGDQTPPKSIGGGTYAKAMPNILAFGPLFPGDEVREHKPNEYILLDRLVKNAQIIGAAILELANHE